MKLYDLYAHRGVEYYLTETTVFVAKTPVARYCRIKENFLVDPRKLTYTVYREPMRVADMQQFCIGYIDDMAEYMKKHSNDCWLGVMQRMQNDPFDEQPIEYLATGNKAFLPGGVLYEN